MNQNIVAWNIPNFVTFAGMSLALLLTVNVMSKFTRSPPRDKDKDGIPDVIDLDDDNDGVMDLYDEDD